MGVRSWPPTRRGWSPSWPPAGRRRPIWPPTSRAPGGGLGCCLCRRHHRLKTHAPRWQFTLTPDGVLSVTTPSGVPRATRPPGLHLDPELLLTPITGPPPDPHDDPPPF